MLGNSKNNNNNFEYISLQDATKFCNYSQEYLSLRARQGKLKSMKLGRNWVTTKEWLVEYAGNVDEYNDSINNGHEKGKAENIIKEKIVKDQAVHSPPENLPIIRYPKIRFNLGTLRPGFAAALVLILITAGGVFGKESLFKTYNDVARSAEKIVRNMETVSDDVFTATVNYKNVFVAVPKNLSDYGQWLKNSYSDANEKVEQKIGNALLALAPEKVGKLAENTYRSVSQNYLAADKNIEQKLGDTLLSLAPENIGQWVEDAYYGLSRKYYVTDKNIEQKVGKALLSLKSAYSSADRSIEQKFATAHNYLGQKIAKTPIVVGNFVKQKLIATGNSIKNFEDGFKSETMRLARSVGDPFVKIYQSFVKAYKFVTSPWKEVVTREGSGKEVVIQRVEVSRVVEPVREVTRETIQQITRVDDAVLAEVRANMSYLEEEIGKRLYAPGGVISQTIYVTEPVSSPKIYQENGDIVLQTLGSGNVILTAATGLQLFGKQVVIESTSLLNPLIYLAATTKIEGDATISGTTGISGDLGVGGTFSSGAANVSGDLTVSGNFTLGGTQTLNGNLIVNGRATSTFAGPIVITTSTASQIRLSYDSSNYTNFGTNSVGDLTITPSGEDVTITGNLLVTGSPNFTGGANFLVPVTITTTSVPQFLVRYDTDNELNIEVAGDGAVLFLATGTDADMELRTKNFDDAFFIDDSTGRVGIATTSPRYKLDVWGDMAVGTSTATSSNGIVPAFYVTSKDRPQIGIGTSTVGSALLTVGTTTSSLVVAANGYVGIGTANPLTRFTIATSTNILTINDTGYMIVGGAATNRSLGNYGDVLIGGKLEIDGLSYFDSNVAIGTTTARYSLDVWGDMAIGTSTGTNVPLLYVDSGTGMGGVGIGTTTLSGNLFTVGTTTPSLVVASNGYVGIGTTTPLAALAVNGGVIIYDGGMNIERDNSFINFVDIGGETFFVHSENGYFGIGYQDGITNPDRVIVTPGGSVGIATTSPRYKFDVYGTMAVGTSSASYTGASSTPALYVISGNGGQVGIGTTTLSTNLLTVGTTTPSLVVASNGYVGIGTITPGSLSPSSKLDVAGSTAGEDVTILVHNTDNTNVESHATLQAITAGASGGDPRLLLTVSGLRDWAMGVDNSDSDSLKFGYSSIIGSSTVFTMNTSGNIGIATSSPRYKLDVWGDMAIGTSTGTNVPALYVQSGQGGRVGIGTTTLSGLLTVGTTTPSLVVAPNGYVGMGTTTPGEILHLVSSGSYIIVEDTRAAGSGGTGMVAYQSALPTAVDQRLGFFFAGSDSGGIRRNNVGIAGLSSAAWTDSVSYPTYLAFYTTPSGSIDRVETMRVDSSGNLGIATTSPRYKLDVWGDVAIGTSTGTNVPLLYVDSGTGLGGVGIGTTTLSGNLLTVGTTTPSLVVASNGYVGIASSTPSDTLAIQGNLISSGVITLYGNTTSTFANNGNIFLTGSGGTGGSGTGAIFFGGYTSRIGRDADGTPIYSDAGNLSFVIDDNNNQSSAYFNVLHDSQTVAGAIELFRVQESGEVGIATSSPRYKLDVWGDMAVGTSTGTNVPLLYVDSGTGFGGVGIGTTTLSGNLLTVGTTTPSLVVAANGFVGIGTISPNIGAFAVTNKILTIISEGTATEGILEVGGNTGTAGSALGSIAFSNLNNAKRGARIQAFTSDTNGSADLTFLTSNAGTLGEIMRITSSSTVGIGTTTPRYKLDVWGDLAVGTSTGTNVPLLYVDSGTGLGGVGIGTTTLSGNLLTVGTTTPSLVVASNGYVGIASSTPSDTFAVQGNLISSGNLTVYGTATSTFVGGLQATAIKLTQNPTVNYVLTSDANGFGSWQSLSIIAPNSWQYIGANAIRPTSTVGIIVSASSTFAGNLSVGTSTAPTLFVDSGNNLVGIASSTPSATLAVAGNIMGSGNMVLYGTATSTIAGPVELANNFRTTGNIYPATDATYFLGSSAARWANIYAATTTIGGTITIDTDDVRATGLLTLSSGGSENIILTPSGNVGIATTTPRYKLDVWGDMAIGTSTGVGAPQNYPMLYVNSGEGGSSNGVGIGTTTVSGTMLTVGTSTPALVVSQNGYVGIGTTTPNVNLNIYNSGSGKALALDGVNNYAGISFRYQGDEKAQILQEGTGNLYIDADTDLQLRPGNSVTATFKSGGNVGIGNSGPTSKLTVSGGDLVVSSAGSATTTISSATSTFAHGLIVDTNSLYVMADTGNVGIGTASPGYQLTMLGAGQITAALTNTGNTGATLLLNATDQGPGSGGALLFGVNNGTYSSSGFYAAIKGLHTNGDQGTIGDLVFSTRNAVGDTALTERMRITSGGNVGMATTTPRYLLDVWGDMAIGTSTGTNVPLLYVDSGTGFGGVGIGTTTLSGNLLTVGTTTPSLVVASNGYVGVASSTPSDIFAVQGNIISSGSLTVYGTATSTFVGGLQATAIKLTTSPNTNYVLTSDANGFGTWQSLSIIAPNSWQYIGANAIRPTSTVGIIVSASSTFAGNLSVGTSTTLFVDSGNGRVGIGTTNPFTPLEIKSSSGTTQTIWTNSDTLNEYSLLRFKTVSEGTGTSGYAKGGIFFVGDGTGTGKGSLMLAVDTVVDTGSVAITDAKLTIDNSGNVGIATSSPRYKLDVWGDMAVGTSTGTGAPMNYPLLYVNSGEGGSSNGVGIGTTTVTGTMLTVGTTTPVLVVANSGYVGIGTTDPGAKLHVYNGNIILENDYSITFKDTGGTARNTIYFDSSNRLNLLNNALGSGGDIRIYSANDVTKGITILSTGLIGIGNTGPTSKLTVNGGDMVVSSAGSATTTISSATSTLAGGLIVDTNSLYVMADTGNVGIGIASPTYTLDVKGSVSTSANLLRLLDSDSTSMMEVKQDSGGNVFMYLRDTSESTDINLNTNGSSWFDGGNVGIATTSPRYKLDVWGDMAVGTTTATTSAGISMPLLYVDSGNGAGKVGIATSTPRYTLDVWGSLAVGTTTSPIFLADTGATGNTPGITVGADISLGSIQVASSSGAITFADMVVEASAGAGTEESYSFQIDSTELFRIYSESNGTGGIQGKKVFVPAGVNFGVGTTTPRYALDVYGTMAVGTSSAGYTGASSTPALYVISGNGGQVGIGTTTVSTNLLTVGTTTPALVVANTGYVGIGTASPTQKLEVTGNIRMFPGGSSDAYLYGNTLDSYVRLDGNVGARLAYTTHYASIDSTGIGMYISGAQKMIVDISGNVGIATTTPRYKLDVWGDIAIGTSTGQIPALYVDSGRGGGVISYSSTTIANYFSVGTSTTPTLFIDSGNGYAIISTPNVSSAFTVAEPRIEATLPLYVNVEGNVGFAYDLEFTDPDLAKIIAGGNLAIEAGTPGMYQDLRLKTRGLGNVLIDISNASSSYSSGFKVLGSNGVLLTVGEPGQVKLRQDTGLVFGEINQKVIGDFENASSADWISYNTANVAVSLESSVAKVGSYALNIAATTSSEDVFVAKNFGSAQDWSSYEKLGFWIRASKLATSTATTTQIISSTIYGSSNNVTSTRQIYIQEANAWQYEEWNISGIQNSTSVDRIAFRMDVGGTSVINFYIDQIRLYNSSERSGEMFVGNDGSLTLLGRGAVEIGRLDGSSNKPGIRVDSAVVEFNQPMSVNTGGDVGINYDLQFLNTGASYITSEGSLWIQAGDPNHADNLYLTTGGTGDVVVELSTSSQEFIVAGNNRYLDVTYAGVVGIGETSPLAFGDFNAQIIDNMEDSVLNWASYNKIYVGTTTETSIVKVGTQALKIYASTTPEDVVVSKAYSATQDWSTYERLSFWIQASQLATSTATTTQMISVGIYGSSNNVTTTHQISVQKEDRWQYEEWNIDNIQNSTSVDRLFFRIDANNISTTNFYIDHMRLYDSDERAADLFVDKDGTLVVTGRNSVELYAPQAGAGNLPGVKVDAAVVELGQPLSVNVGGDVGFDYDLQFLNTGLAQVTSEGPLRIAAGDSNHSENLTLTTGGSGDVIVELSASSSAFMITHAWSASTTVPFIINSESNSTTTAELDRLGILFQVISDYSSDENTVFSIDASGNFYYDRGAYTPAADVAENYYVQDESIGAGDVVCLTGTSLTVEKCSTAYESDLLGVISTQPALLMGNDMLSARPVALIGRVPVKISIEAGPIAIGDSLTSASSTPGAAMKATGSGKILGYALEPFDGGATSTDTIFAFINLQDRSSGDLTVFENSDGNIEVRTMTQNGLATLFKLDEEGALVVDKIKTNQLCVGSVCVTENEFMKIFGAGIAQVLTTSTEAVCTNGTNQACSSEIGACQIGVQVCENGQWGSCIGAVFPTTEIFDEVDNDCDGLTDEGLSAPITTSTDSIITTTTTEDISTSTATTTP